MIKIKVNFMLPVLGPRHNGNSKGQVPSPKAQEGLQLSLSPRQKTKKKVASCPPCNLEFPKMHWVYVTQSRGGKASPTGSSASYSKAKYRSINCLGAGVKGLLFRAFLKGISPSIPQPDIEFMILLFIYFLLLFKYSCLHFPPTSHPHSYPTLSMNSWLF